MVFVQSGCVKWNSGIKQLNVSLMFQILPMHIGIVLIDAISEVHSKFKLKDKKEREKKTKKL